MLNVSDVEFLRLSTDRNVEIETRKGEKLIAKVLCVMQSDEYEEHELLYEVVSSNMLDSYKQREIAGGYVLDFNEIVSVRTHQS